MSLNCYTPRETIELVSRAGAYKANMRKDKVFMSSFYAGLVLAFACATTLSTYSSEWFQENAAGLIRTAGALVFPYGLTIITLTGADLCTGSFMYTTVAFLHRRISVSKMLMHWFICFWGNLAGSLFTMGIILGYGGSFDNGFFKVEAQRFAITKQVVPRWHQIFLRGIGANMMVCLACFLAASGRDTASKVIGIWWPIFAFVSLGLDHVVANMFFIPMGMWQGAPISSSLYIYKGIIPALLGNIIGGGLFVGTFFWYLYIMDSPEASVDGMYYDSIPNHDPNGRGMHLRKPDDEESGISKDLARAEAIEVRKQS